MDRTSSSISPPQPPSSSGPSYAVFLNNPQFNPKTKNKISTSKYQWNSFLPKMLMEQFTRMANAYFLIIAIFQSEKEISYSNGNPVILLPLCFVILINGIKDLFEDNKRKQSDQAENNSLCQVYNKQTNTFSYKKWKDIVLGDIVKVENNRAFPADLLLLNSSNPNGTCHVETTNIDGETNLKQKQANPQLKALTQHTITHSSNNNGVNVNAHRDTLTHFNYVCVTKPPNEYIYQFEGVLYKTDRNGEIDNYDSFIYVDKDSFLLRGCYLKETEYIIGSVIYVGNETKSIINTPNARGKVSSLERLMNYQILVIFLLQIVLSSICAVIYILKYIKQLPYLKTYIYVDKTQNDYSIWQDFPISMGIWTLLFTNFVPISLLVTLEGVKFFQAYLIGCDVGMFDTIRKIGTTVHSSTLNEELGQVKYVFTDKTGTLTKNNMMFKCISVDGKVYWSNELDKMKLNMNKKNDAHAEAVHLFMVGICTCNSVIPDTKGKDNNSNNEIEYHASSPDEKALVCFAKTMGYVFKERMFDKTIKLQIENKEYVYEILNVFEYTSERKRMGVIVKTPSGNIKLFVKGADSIVSTLLSQDRNDVIKQTQLHLDTFAIQGLRTLMFAYKPLTTAEYTQFNANYQRVTANINKTEHDIETVYASIESNLTLLGATAIEDELADGVSDTIASLIKIGIKIWMLTGDKLETAKNIAYSCNLFHKNMTIITIKEHSSSAEIQSQLYSQLQRSHNKSIGLLISSETLSIIFSDNALLELFYKIIIRCQSVICSRVSPKQKAEMVSLIQNNEAKVITLAIGDGANDVSMINEAHIGVGIKGKEGTQAARASDYAICEFKYLRQLLFYHGREAYRKNAYCVCYNFYKNFLLVSPQLWNGMLSFFSGQSVYEALTYQLFNPIFTSLPICWFGVFDVEHNKATLTTNEKYYTQGLYGKLFHYKRFWKWLLLGTVQGLAVVLFCIEVMSLNDHQGFMFDNWSVSTMVFEVNVIISNLKIAMDSSEHSVMSVLLQGLSVVLFYVVVWAFSGEKFGRSEMYGNITMVVLDLKCNVGVIEICALLLMFDYFIQKVSVYYGFVLEGHKLQPYRREFTEEEKIAGVIDDEISALDNDCTSDSSVIMHRKGIINEKLIYN